MRRVWATLVSVWMVLAIVAVLAWTRQPPIRVVTQPVSSTFLLRTKNGKTQRVIVVGAPTTGTVHATTQTSPPPVG